MPVQSAHRFPTLQFAGAAPAYAAYSVQPPRRLGLASVHSDTPPRTDTALSQPLFLSHTKKRQYTKDMVREIKLVLNAKGYKVFVDVDSMQGAVRITPEAVESAISEVATPGMSLLVKDTKTSNRALTATAVDVPRLE